MTHKTYKATAKSQISASQVGFRKRNFQKTDPLIYSTCLLSAYRLLWISKNCKLWSKVTSGQLAASFSCFFFGTVPHNGPNQNKLVKKIIKGKLRIKSEHKLAEIASFMQLLT